MPGPHDKIIADAAKIALGPSGFRRKGRSRVWFADHGWWLGIVEFQPSSWSKGSYLNVAAHWLWTDIGALSFDYGGRIAEHEQYLSNEQFIGAAFRLATLAAKESERLVQLFPSLSAAADVLLKEAEGRGGRMTLNAAIAAGLCNRRTEADRLFHQVADGFAASGSIQCRTAERMAKLVAEPLDFRREIASIIGQRRSSLKLSSLDIFPPGQFHSPEV